MWWWWWWYRIGIVQMFFSELKISVFFSSFLPLRFCPYRTFARTVKMRHLKIEDEFLLIQCISNNVSIPNSTVLNVKPLCISHTALDWFNGQIWSLLQLFYGRIRCVYSRKWSSKISKTMPKKNNNNIMYMMKCILKSKIQCVRK